MASDESSPRIEPAPDGPLKVTGLGDFRNSRGEAITVEETMSLRRCGASKRKSFCDGTHASIGFIGARSPERVEDRLDRYEGGEITISDNRGQCSHAGHCASELPAVWRMGVEPWIDPDGAPAPPRSSAFAPTRC